MQLKGNPNVFPAGTNPVAIVIMIFEPFATDAESWGWKDSIRGPQYPSVIARTEVNAGGTTKEVKTDIRLFDSGVVAKGRLMTWSTSAPFPQYV